ncbi:MAG TPA: DUF2357 domain-containing protein [Firmicutes bacterium]|nr:DUF2357 domain-containing protein [Bacillota bacterium]
MATQPKLPFSLALVLHPEGERRVLNLEKFTTDEASAEVSAYFLEYTDCDLEFRAIEEPPEEAWVTIDGFDALFNTQREGLVDRYGRLVLCCNHTLPIQRHNESEFPWIPGNYRVEVRWGDVSYFTVLNVRPKHFKAERLEIMRQELEEYVVGLTLDLIRKNQGLGHGELASFMPARYYQYQLLEKYFPTLNAALADVVTRPNHAVRKQYEVTDRPGQRPKDARSYRWQSSHRGYARNGGNGPNQRFALVPRSTVDYDLPENRWAKKIVSSFIEIMHEIAESIEQLLERREELPQIARVKAEQQLATVQRLQARLRSVLAEPFFQEVCAQGVCPYTPALQWDGRYRTLYRFWWDLLNHSHVQVNATFEYQWKKTDLLWEYWCLVKTLQALQSIGFTPESGWIYDHRWRFPDRVFIPSIPKGTKVLMRRGRETLAVYYEEELPTLRQTALDMGALLYLTSNHNLPDIRLDYAIDGQYQFSVIVEAKYRRRWHIWRMDGVGNGTWTDTMHQLKDYLSIRRTDDEMRRAVKELIVLYPKDQYFDVAVHETGTDIVLVQLQPGNSDHHYVKHLAQLWPPDSGK